MAECILRDGMVISDYARPYVIAEVNSSHNGNIDIAKQMIDAAVDMGCDCVKFQSWSVDSLYSETYYKENPISKRFVKKFSLRPEQLKGLADYCRKKNIAFSSTPYSENEVDFLVQECQVPYIKIASMEINNPKFLSYIGKKHIPIFISTGMATTDEIEEAISILHNEGAEHIVVLHCVSIYPTSIQDVNLNNILGLRERFPMHPIGFSDHTVGDIAAIAATALGVGVIEKHMTLDKKKVGLDNSMATEPDEFAELVRKCRDTQIAMGDKERRLSEEEIDQQKKMRRSIVSSRNISAGEVLREEDLYAKRPGTGIKPNEIGKVVGKIAKVDIPSDTIILPEQIG